MNHITERRFVIRFNYVGRNVIGYYGGPNPLFIQLNNITFTLTFNPWEAFVLNKNEVDIVKLHIDSCGYNNSQHEVLQRITL